MRSDTTKYSRNLASLRCSFLLVFFSSSCLAVYAGEIEDGGAVLDSAAVTHYSLGSSGCA